MSTSTSSPEPRSDVWHGGSPQEFDPWPDTGVHVEWGRIGAQLAAERGDAIVIVDVLSLSTTLTMAAECGMESHVYSGPELERMGGREVVAEAIGAVPAAEKRAAAMGEVSLSPASLVSARPIKAALFTSLNGALAVSVTEPSPFVIIGCLRNHRAVTKAIVAWMADHPASRVTIVACGEHWSSVSRLEGLRPSLEDYLGAGALADGLLESGLDCSVEARAAAATFRAIGVSGFATYVSARELIAAGFAADVELAGQLDVTTAVPVRSDDPTTPRCFTPLVF